MRLVLLEMPPSPVPSPNLMELPVADPGISLLAGWLPLVIEVAAVLATLGVLALRPRRWRLVWLPVCVAIGAAAGITACMYTNSEGLASDPSPPVLWVWFGVFGAVSAAAILGWRHASWWLRGLSFLAVPLTLLTFLVTLNQWVGYYSTLQVAWGAITAGPLPNEINPRALAGLRNSSQTTGKIVAVDIPGNVSGFKHRTEYVYVPPAWFRGVNPPVLPAVMMIAGEFSTAGDWIRSGNALQTIEGYASEHNGVSPIFVFVDSSGAFNNDTECVNGPRGNAADHLTKDVRPYVVDQYNASSDPQKWGVVGFSMGGTCAFDLTVMHPDLFNTFVDIGGDLGPAAGNKDQTIARLFGGNAAMWDEYDPETVMARHGAYRGVAGWIEESVKPDNARELTKDLRPNPQSNGRPGYGGHREWGDNGRVGAAGQLCAAATKVDISCQVHTVTGFHTWQFGARGLIDSFPWLADRLLKAQAG